MTEEPQYKVERKKPGMSKRAKAGFFGLLGAASVVALYTVVTAGATRKASRRFSRPQRHSAQHYQSRNSPAVSNAIACPATTSSG